MWKRILFSAPGLALVLAVVLTLRPRPAAGSFEEYYARMYPLQKVVGDNRDSPRYDYPQLMAQAKEILVVAPVEELGGGGSGYIEDKSYAGTDPLLRYRFWAARTLRRVEVLQVVKGDAEPGMQVWVMEQCVLEAVQRPRLLAHQEDVWPMVKGCVYLLFLDRAVSDPQEDLVLAKPISGPNGWYDLTHLSLNHPDFLPVLAAALADQGLLSDSCRQELGELTAALAEMDAPYDSGAWEPEGAEWQDFTLAAPWTDRRYPLRAQYAVLEGRTYFRFPRVNGDGSN